MVFRLALLRAASQRTDLDAEQRKMLRKVIFWPRRRVDGELVMLDDMVEAETIGLVMASEPSLFAAAALVPLDSPSLSPVSFVGKVDWSKLIDWLVENLPKIIEIIMMILALF